MDALEARIAPLRQRLAYHSLYRSLDTLENLRHFMESHVFAVWDFMSLLKSLQRSLSCVDVPWLPSAHPQARRLVNEIVLGEESDLYQGRSVSHFELYVEAMRQCGASTVAIDALLRQFSRGLDLPAALAVVPQPARSFVQTTFATLAQNKPHATAAAFTFGREDLIPEMFRGFIRDLNQRLAGEISIFQWYLERHIEVDGEEHGPMAREMMIALCRDEVGRDDKSKWAEAAEAAETALQARLALWDALIPPRPLAAAASIASTGYIASTGS